MHFVTQKTTESFSCTDGVGPVNTSAQGEEDLIGSRRFKVWSKTHNVSVATDLTFSGRKGVL